MLTRLNVRDKEKPETARRRFDGQLSVRAWATPGSDYVEVQADDRRTPYWWDGDEEASQSFLAAMGVTLQ